MADKQKQLLAVLEDSATVLRKTQINLKKCPKERLTKGYIESRIKMIDEYWTTFNNGHQELVKVTPVEQKGVLPYFLNEEFFTYEDLYNVLRGDLMDKLATIVQETAMETSIANSSYVMAGTQNNFVRLPRIELSTFSGSYEEWPAFKDLFISLVHNNQMLSDVQRLHYLKTSVTAEAASLLRHIPITSDNYSQAWQILKTRYGNKRLILNNNLKKLVYQRKMTTQSAAQLKLLLDTTSECLHNINNLNVPVDSWDPLVIFLLVQKLDPETHKSWEEHAYKNDSEPLPKWTDFKEFLEAKFRTLELITTNSKEVKPTKERSTYACHVATPTFEKSENRNCLMCKESHTLCHCKEFTKMEPTERSEYVKNKNLCFNCLVSGHSASKCRVPVSCRICHRRHHSLLHQQKQTEPVAPTSPSQPPASKHVVEDIGEVKAHTVIASHLTTRQGSALLATAVVEARSNQGHNIPLRALIDLGSEESFISEKATQLLKLDRYNVKGSITGLGPMRTEINHVTQLQIKSQWDKTYVLPVIAYVMSKQLTKKIPKKYIAPQQEPHLQGLQLADPTYHKPAPIDLLLGVRVYARILQGEVIKGPPGKPIAQKTDLGWIVFGENNTTPREDNFFVMHHQVDVDDVLKSIWEIDTDTKRTYTKEEQLCEEIYEQTVTRNDEGRYIVKLPFKAENPKVLEGNTKEIATKRFMQLERKFKRLPNLKEDYTRGINDYLEEGHLEVVPEIEKEDKAVYLPHVAVIREDKETTRTRIVFDASCKGSNNISLNDELMVGPQLQDDLRNLLMRWRMKRVCFVADIQKMYRQILVTKEDANFQRILWRQDESEELKEYRMLRVTFGTAPAPYLAVKTLQKTAIDEEEKQIDPQVINNHREVAIKTIKEDFYMDDLLSGAATAEDAISTAKEITRILKQGGFQLTKWSSNNLEFMKSIDDDKRSASAQVEMNLDGTIKALGIVWNMGADQFQYNLSLPPLAEKITKRGILSDVQKLFDPLGWIAPSTVLAKMLMQKLWLEKAAWDEGVSSELEEEWRQIRDDFENVKDIKMERWLGTIDSGKTWVQIHGFSDASMRAYAAVVYIRVESNDSIKTKVIAARTRVAPLKTISLPRLELCGALLLSKLMKQVGQAMRIPTTNMFAWTDSQIVIAWLCGEPSRWKPFVANRVVEIVENLHNKHWYHVQSKDNPADIASRGMMLSTLKNCDLWWNGPSWLSEKEIKINTQHEFTTNEEMKTQKIQTYLTTEDLEKQENGLTTQFEEFDSLTELLKGIIYCRRFINFKKDPDNVDKDITTMELQDALNVCIKKVQQEEFQEEIERLESNKQVKRKSCLRSLAPYVDENKLLRVGGRLRYADIEEDRKHPIILGNKNKLVPLIIADAHARTLHGTMAEMLCYLRSKFWILRAKSLVKRYIQKCLTCAKQNATSKTQIMGDLPEKRVTPSRPFLHSGVDFAGPYQILTSKGRGGKTVKAYIAIFICMAVKAIHIELVGDLTSEAFISAFKRFVARRGKCTHLWSDQGRNFVGANRELVEAWNEAKLKFTGPVAESLAVEGTQWHFIPAYSPNFGGLWEAGVKSIKYHLKRILTTNLTFEEMASVLCQIESCLNSRPLCPLDDADPENVELLTPGHFLIGEAPIVVPAADYKESKIHTLTRWQYTQKLLADFWRRWQEEYLSRLQQRPKWLKKEQEFKIGDIVLIKTDNLPPGKWSLGRVMDKHPAEDGFTRVYSVKSGSAIVKRSVTKLCALPVDTQALQCQSN